MGHHQVPPMDSTEEIASQANMVHLQQDPMDLVVLLPLSMELHQLQMDLGEILQPRAGLVMVVLPLLHQTDLVVILLPDMVLLHLLAGSVPVPLLHNMVHLQVQTDLVGLPSVAMAVLPQVPHDLAEYLQTNMVLLQLSVAMVLLFQHSMAHLQVRGNSELLRPTNMVHLQRLVVMVALPLTNMELLQKTMDLVDLLPASTVLH
jgi:hypothetical protein